MSTARNMDSFAAPPEMLRERRLTPKKIRKRREQFAIVPMGTWYERLQGASGATWQLAVYLIHLHWKGDGKPIKLTNGMLGEDGISRWSKYHGLRELERPGLRRMATKEVADRHAIIVKLLTCGFSHMLMRFFAPVWCENPHTVSSLS